MGNNALRAVACKLLHIFFIVLVTSGHVFSMEISELEKHKNAFRKIGHATNQRIGELQNAVQYIEQHAQHDPQQAVWLNKCKLVSEIIIPHLQKEIEFDALLAKELMQPNKALWRHIRPLLEKVGGFTLNNDMVLIEQLSDLRDNPHASHAAWVAILEQYKARITPPAQEVVPELPPLPEIKTEIIADHSGTAPQEPQVGKAPEAQLRKKERKREAKKKRRERKREQKLEEQKVTPQKVALQKATTSGRLKPIDAFWLKLLNQDILSAEALIITDTIPLDKPHPSLQLTPLHYAIGKNNKAMCKMLLDHGADPEMPSIIPYSKGEKPMKTSALMFAVTLGHTECIEQLLSSKAKPDHGSKCTQTGQEEYPLEYACVPLCSNESVGTPYLQRKMVKLLLEHGATKFNRKVIFLDHGSKYGTELKLTSSLDQMLIQALLAKKNAVEAIACYQGNIFLLGDPSVNVPRYHNAPDVAKDSEDIEFDSADVTVEELNKLTLESNESNDSVENEQEN